MTEAPKSGMGSIPLQVASIVPCCEAPEPRSTEATHITVAVQRQRALFHWKVAKTNAISVASPLEVTRGWWS